MKVTCPSCQRTVRLGEKAERKYAGREIACPNCSEMLPIPAVGSAVTAPDPEGGPSIASEAETSSQPSGKVKPPLAAPARPKPPRARRPSQNATPTPPAIHADTREPLARRSRPKRKSKLPLLLGVGGAVAVLAVVAVAAVLLSGGGDSQPGGNRPAAADGRGAPPRRPAGARGSIEFQLGDAGRSEVAIRIDGQRVAVPRTGAVQIDVAAGSRLAVLQRRGYQQVDMQFVVPEGDCVVGTPEWKPLLLDGIGNSLSTAPGHTSQPSGARGFGSWIQDFESAQHLASQEKKDILLVFSGSDWNGHSIRMADNVFLQPRFHDAIQMRYVPVFVDFPEGAAAQARVQDIERNLRLYTQFGRPSIPVVAVTDSDGLPYGWAGYADGVDQFLSSLDAAREARSQRDSLLMEISLSTGQDRSTKAMALFALLGELRVLPFYLRQFGDWFVEARENDPKNEQGELEAFFEILWFAQLSDTIRTSPHGLGQVIQQLSSWDAEHEFKDQERAVRLYFRAACLSQGTPEVMRRFAAEGIKYETSDAELAKRLKYLHDVAGELNIVSSGSGFAVGPGGYVLTNHHVVESIDNEGVRLTVHGVAGQEPLSAEVVAANPEQDLALVRIFGPPNVVLSPLPVSSVTLARGQSVAAFGYPLGEAVGHGVKLSTGYVSATQAQTDNGMILLDCRINPGNSGGPICDKNGQVVGIVTAKSFSSGEVDSYGMAVPGDQMVAFLQEHMPGFAAADPPQGVAGPADWAAVDQKVSPSVVMLMLRLESQ